MTVVALEATHLRIRSAALLGGAVFVVGALVAWWAATPNVIGVWHDDGVYVLLGRAIASGHGFHYTQLPGAPAATHYPPLYPLLAALVWRVAPSFPDNIAAFLMVNVLLVGAAALGTCRFVRTRLEWSMEGAALVALVATLTTPVLALSGAVLAEPLFLAALWPVLAAGERAAEPTGSRRDAFVAGAAVGALMLIPPLLGAAFVVALPWQLWTWLASPTLPAPLEGAYGSYLGWFADGVRTGGTPFVLATIRMNARERWLLLQDRLVIRAIAPPRLAAASVLLVVIVAGLIPLARRAAVTAGFLVLYLAVVVVWPYTPRRFLWGVWPVVMLSAAAGAAWLYPVAPVPAPRVLAALCIALPAMAMARTEWRAYGARGWSAPALEAGVQITPLVVWVGRDTTRSDVVLAEGEQAISLFTGRRAGPTAPFSALEYVVPRSVAGATPGLREVGSLPRSAVFEVVP